MFSIIVNILVCIYDFPKFNENGKQTVNKKCCNFTKLICHVKSTIFWREVKADEILNKVGFSEYNQKKINIKCFISQVLIRFPFLSNKPVSLKRLWLGQLSVFSRLKSPSLISSSSCPLCCRMAQGIYDDISINYLVARFWRCKVFFWPPCFRFGDTTYTDSILWSKMRVGRLK